MFQNNPKKYEVMRLQVRHPLYSDESRINDATDLAIHEGDEEDLRHAVSQGWEVKASVTIPVPDSKGCFIEIITLQRSDLNPDFGKKTFSDEYLKESQITFKERKELYS